MSDAAFAAFFPAGGILFVAYLLVMCWGMTEMKLWGWIMFWILATSIAALLLFAIIRPIVAFFQNGDPW